MKKWLWGCGVVLALIAGLLLFGLSELGPIIKTAVNSEGPKITKTDVHVESVSVSILSGEAVLKGLVVGNPRGFNASEALKVGSIYVDVDKESLTEKIIIINKIEVVAPVVTYERHMTSDNIEAILNNVKETIGAGEGQASEPTSASSSGEKLLIRDFVVKEGKVSLYITAGRSVTARLPEIHLQDIGGQKEGTTPARAAREMLAAVYKRVQSPEVLGVFRQQLEKLDIHVEGLDLKSLPGKLDQKAGSVFDKLKGLIRDR